mgnify:FL=1
MIHDELKRVQQVALRNAGIERLNVMQESVVRHCSIEKNMVLLSPTGTGKTLAFL